MSDSKLSIEVQLAWEVMTCRGMRSTYDSLDSPCQWFNEHYGPYPAYTLNQEPHTDIVADDGQVTLKAECKGMRFNVPEIIGGCRKAPIMSIGINPNLTSYQLSMKGATWCYPYFDDIEKYAHYFRYRTINQERFTPNFIKKYTAKDSQILAKKDGEVTDLEVKNDNISVQLKYNTGETDTIRVTRDYELFCSKYGKYSKFKEGDLIAGKLSLPDDKDAKDTEIVLEPVGYYKRFNMILQKFKDMAGGDLKNVQIGEDASQGDMVACASPGWNAYFPDNVLNGIVDECVRKRNMLGRQLVQSRPAVIVFSGNGAISMFDKVFGKNIEPELDAGANTFKLLKDCLSKPYWLRISDSNNNINFTSRLIFAPHFSYPDNYKSGCRLTAENWKKFKADFEADVKSIDEDENVKEVYGGGVNVTINPDADEWKSKLTPKAAKLLAKEYIDPVDTIARIMLQEYEAGRIKLDKNKEHLERTDGPCRFCSNELFEIEGGCKYGKREQHPDEIISSRVAANAAAEMLR